MSRDNEWAGNAPGYKAGYEWQSDRMRLDHALGLDPAGFRWFYPMTEFIVVRGTGSPDHDGVWFTRQRLIHTAPIGGLGEVSGSSVTAHATGRYERRDDGALAEVFEVGWRGDRRYVRRRSVLAAVSPAVAVMSYGSAVR